MTFNSINERICALFNKKALQVLYYFRAFYLCTPNEIRTHVLTVRE